MTDGHLHSDSHYVSLDPERDLWSRFYMPSPLVVIGTREPDGTYDLAPKTMVTPLGWEAYFGFVCTPEHATYRNAAAHHFFTVSFPAPDQVVQASLSAASRQDGDKRIVADLRTEPAVHVDGVVLSDAPVVLECTLHSIVDGFGGNSLIAGKVIAARARQEVIRFSDVNEDELIARAPVLVYLDPERFAVIERSLSFPFPAGFSR